MTSTPGSNHQHPPSSSAEISTTQPAHSSSIDPNSHLSAGYAPNENQLAGLVEAATAAAGQDVSDWTTAAAVAAAAGNQHHLDGYGPEIHIDEDSFGDPSFGASLTANRQLKGSGDHAPPSGLSRTVSKKRKRNEDTLDPALAAASSGMGLGAGHYQQHNQQHSPHPQQYEGDGLDIRPVPAQSLSDARAVGLHSAAALFRQPSSNKKHTRPPMAKMFTSLELSPENFLQLQAAAKNYMLDDEHPERRECVGQRGKGDSEMVKLRLWNCVRHFLEAEGHGERFFGEHAINEGITHRAHVWPRDQQKIIALIIPLLRRMVTNERQRKYAVETRKGGGPDERRRRKTDESLPNANSASPPRYDEQFQMHAQHHTIPEEFPPAPPMPNPQPQMGQSDTQLGLTDLLLDGYPTDWEAVARSYDMYNQDYELDSLWGLSGLQQPDWRGLVAAVDSHYQVFHQGDFDCPRPCEDENIHRILEADAMAALRWRVGGNRYTPAKNELYVFFFFTFSPLSFRRVQTNSSTVPAVSLVTSRVSSVTTSLPNMVFMRLFMASNLLLTRPTTSNIAMPPMPPTPPTRRLTLLC